MAAEVRLSQGGVLGKSPDYPPPDGLRAVAQACEIAARKIEQRHGQGESGLTIIEGDIT